MCHDVVEVDLQWVGHRGRNQVQQNGLWRMSSNVRMYRIKRNSLRRLIPAKEFGN